MLQAKLNEIIEKHGKWLRDEKDGVRANLRRANLSGLDFSGANLYGANLSGANLRRANLFNADLRRANLSGVDLQLANISEADLSWVDLIGAHLAGADLTGANLYVADLSGADLTGANLYVADLSGADFTGAVGVPEEIKGHRKLIAETVLANPSGLEMNTWHTCETIHCIAGWACHLAPNGRWIESQLGTAYAARFLLGLLGKDEDDVFYKPNEEAMEVLKEWAKEER